MSKKDNNTTLYWIIWVLALIIVGWAGYMMGQSGNTTPTWNDTPLVIEAGKIGLDTDDLKECIAENKFVSKINSQMKVGADNFGITWTPWNVLINNQTGEYVVISGAYPKESFIENFDKLLSEEVAETKTEENSENKKTFKENTDKKSLIIITDKRDSASQIDQIVTGLKEIPAIKDLNIEKYDFSDNGVEDFLKENAITMLPAVIFSNNEVDENINKFLTKLTENSYSLNIGAKFDPFAKLSSKWFKIVSKDLINSIKKDSYIDWKEDAKITWLEYSDLECPFCAKLHNSDVESSLKAKYGDDLSIIFNHFPLGFHQKAIPWANILECVWQEGWSEAFYKILKYAYKNKIQE